MRRLCAAIRDVRLHFAVANADCGGRVFRSAMREERHRAVFHRAVFMLYCPRRLPTVEGRQRRRFEMKAVGLALTAFLLSGVAPCRGQECENGGRQADEGRGKLDDLDGKLHGHHLLSVKKALPARRTTVGMLRWYCESISV